MAENRFCLAVHGHFYQPPRENPWLNAVEPQPSAFPWSDWNRRIAEECYLPMARSRIRNAAGNIVDLYSNYPHMSFNFGPTLLSWMKRCCPEMLGHLRDAAALNPHSAMAQAYGHAMLPLADADDRHTQIAWGLEEFRRRFGFSARGMWLPECGIDGNAVRSLVDNGVEYVILSPRQASRVRPFGEQAWRNVAAGGVDTRRTYRLYDVDGRGRTHFDRWVDVVFYTPGLNLGISFGHLLNDPDGLRRGLLACYDHRVPSPQLASIVTDGEIYGHHERNGGEGLSRLFREIVPESGLRLTTVGEFVAENPPLWEVALWDGEDGNGTSWSCPHGMGRWFRDCGCRPPAPDGWNQEWRRPLREAFDELRNGVRRAVRAGLRDLVRDWREARNDYVRVILSPGPGEREEFVRRHASRELAADERRRLWRLLEADHNAMRMYTSCGWFFDELSGLEPAQNMRYALRAAELAESAGGGNPNLERGLAAGLAKAKSNIEEFGDGAEVFRRLVLPSRHSDAEIAAAYALCAVFGLPTAGLGFEIVESSPPSRRGAAFSGRLVLRDSVLAEDIHAEWTAEPDGPENTGVFLAGLERTPAGAEPRRRDGSSGPAAGVFVGRLPAPVRERAYRILSAGEEAELVAGTCGAGKRALPFIARSNAYGIPVPAALRQAAESHVEHVLTAETRRAVETGDFGPARISAVGKAVAEAKGLGIPVRDWQARLELTGAARELLHWLHTAPEGGWRERRAAAQTVGGGEWASPETLSAFHSARPDKTGLSLALGRFLAWLCRKFASGDDSVEAAVGAIPLLELLDFSRQTGLPPLEDAGLDRSFWDFLSRMVSGRPGRPLADRTRDRLLATGAALGFGRDEFRKRLEGLFPDE